MEWKPGSRRDSWTRRLECAFQVLLKVVLLIVLPLLVIWGEGTQVR